MGCIHSDSNEYCVGSELDYLKRIDALAELASLKNHSSRFEISRSQFSNSKQLLGVGGFGIVRRVERLVGEDKGVSYAMKSVSKVSALQCSTGYESVFNELKALVLIKEYPFISNVRYAFQDNVFLYLVLDLSRCGDLRVNLRHSSRHCFPEKISKFFAAQIILAVQFCHSKNIIHRDIKPENILVGENGYIKLCDFGVSKILKPFEECFSTSGTHGYMAPEVYRGGHGKATDWFAVGVTLHEMICGRRPFESSRMKAFANDLHYDSLQISSLDKGFLHISPACKSIIFDFLSPDPRSRLGLGELREIELHRWFDDFDWLGLGDSTLRSCFRPRSDRWSWARVGRELGDCGNSSRREGELEEKSALEAHAQAKCLDAHFQTVFKEYWHCASKYEDDEERERNEDERDADEKENAEDFSCPSSRSQCSSEEEKKEKKVKKMKKQFRVKDISNPLSDAYPLSPHNYFLKELDSSSPDQPHDTKTV